MIFLPTKQYQAIHISIYFTSKIEPDAYLYRFLLARILTSYTTKYPSKQQLSKKLNALYGMFITNHVFILKDYHIMRFNFVLPNPIFVDDPHMIEDVIEIFKDMFFNRPMFDQSIFESAKRYTLNEIQSKKDHKFMYAKEQLQKHIFLDHPYGKPITGTLEELSHISLTEVHDYYLNYFLKDDIKIYVSGHLPSILKDKLENLAIYEQEKMIEPVQKLNIHQPIRTYDETLIMGQTYLFFAYYLDIDRSNPLYFASLLTTMLIGGFPESILYKLLRETYFIAYDVDAKFESDKSHVIVYAGVQSEKYDLAYHLIIEALNNFIFDGPSDHQLKEAKDYLSNELYSSLDFQDSMIPKAFIQNLYGYNQSIDAFIDQINNVSVEDIFEVLQQLKLTTTYKVIGGETYEV